MYSKDGQVWVDRLVGLYRFWITGSRTLSGVSEYPRFGVTAQLLYHLTRLWVGEAYRLGGAANIGGNVSKLGAVALNNPINQQSSSSAGEVPRS